jgi:hypothetical protein
MARLYILWVDSDKATYMYDDAICQGDHNSLKFYYDLTWV